jgi:hypothetical protein
MHRYPGPGAYPAEDNRASVLGEFGGLSLKLNGHTWTHEAWGYQGTTSSAHLTRPYQVMLNRVYELKKKEGLSAAIYTQLTDVETECNGLVTYDRRVIKPDLEKVAQANRGKSELPEMKVIVPTSEANPASWRYTFETPGPNWNKPKFNTKTWKSGRAGFGHGAVADGIVRTDWHTTGIFMRREIKLPEVNRENLYLLIHHDDDVEVYLNGVRAIREKGASNGYIVVGISDEALSRLKPGKNLLAVSAKNTSGKSQYIDVGLISLEFPSHSNRASVHARRAPVTD